MIPVRMRFTATKTRQRDHQLVTSLEGVEHVEEVADLMPHWTMQDSRSAGLSDNREGGASLDRSGSAERDTARRVREIAEAARARRAVRWSRRGF